MDLYQQSRFLNESDNYLSTCVKQAGIHVPVHVDMYMYRAVLGRHQMEGTLQVQDTVPLA